MPALVQTFVDSVISISAALPASQTTTDYDGLSFTVIGQVTSWTPGGRTHTLTPSNPVNQRSTDYYKGTNSQSMDSFTVNRADGDAGQVIALTAEASDADFSYKVEYQDGSIDYFQGIVGSYITGAGDGNAIVSQVLSVQRTKNTVSKAAA